MRKGFLVTLIVSCVTGSAVLAQGPLYYPPAYGPVPAPPGSGYGPQVLYGGTLQADGPILLPGQKIPPPTPKQTKTKDEAQKKQAKATSVSAVFHPLTWFAPAPPIPPTQPAQAATQSAAVKNGPIQQIANTVAAKPTSYSPPPQPPSFQAGELVGITTAPGFASEGAIAPPAEACSPNHDLDHHGDPRLPEMPCGYRFYGSADWLYWFVKQPQAPPLVIGITPTGARGVIGNGILPFDNGQHEGMRASFGAWLNNCQTVGLEVGFLTLFDRTPSALANPGSDTVLFRPFINASTGVADAVLLTNPGISTGISRIETFSHMWSIEANLRAEACRFTGGHIDLLAGFRHLELDENLSINDRVQFENVPVFLSQATVITQDSFGTHNRFDGGQIGMEAQFQYGPFYLDMWGKVALGNNHEHVLINGSTVITGSPVLDRNIRAAGGVLALPTNIGAFDHDRFAIVPEFGIKAGWRICDSIRIGAGYSFLYISRVDRPGDQIDRVVNPTQIPQLFLGPLSGPARPMLQFHETDFWAHGVSVEIEYRF